MGAPSPPWCSCRKPTGHEMRQEGEAPQVIESNLQAAGKRAPWQEQTGYPGLADWDSPYAHAQRPRPHPAADGSVLSTRESTQWQRVAGKLPAWGGKEKPTLEEFRDSTVAIAMIKEFCRKRPLNQA